ncbi:hypothetical protein Ple7327_4094 [Pleurocapsa sp. PCC 7327]|nr:hypothetical protein Ple7327_4094 [Pleurocapsa sp. PCC 7327]
MSMGDNKTMNPLLDLKKFKLQAGLLSYYKQK